MNLVFIGYRGSGKTTVGRKVSLCLGRGFVDTDEVIETRANGSIRDIVCSYGWGYFRAIEKEVIRELSKKDRLVISTGGGAVLDGENVEALRSNGLIIWLKGEPEILLKRIAGDARTGTMRPSLTEKGLLEGFREVLVEREPLYKGASHIEVDTSGLDIDEVVFHVLSILRERRVMIALGRELIWDDF